MCNIERRGMIAQMFSVESVNNVKEWEDSAAMYRPGYR